MKLLVAGVLLGVVALVTLVSLIREARRLRIPEDLESCTNDQMRSAWIQRQKKVVERAMLAAARRPAQYPPHDRRR